ncbi:MAG: TolC family protein [Polyangiaceae bacterium]
MRATLTFFVIVAGMLATAQADAQGEIPPSMTTPRAMTLAEAIAYAKAHQPAVLTGIARVTARQKAASVPRAQWYPSFGATLQTFAATANNSTASYVTQGSVDIPRIGGESVSTGSSWQPEASTFVGAGARQEVYDFGRIAAEVAATDELVDVEKQASANALLDVTYSVEEAYFAVHAAKAVLTAAEDAYTRAKSHRDLAKSGVDSGMRSPIELTRADADLARFDAGRIRARGGTITAQAMFAAAIGAPDAALDVAGTPAAPPDLPTLNDAISRAEARDPRILQVLAELRADEERTRAIGAQMRPNVYATALISGRAGGATASSGEALRGDGLTPSIANWDVGLVLSWPVFDPAVRARTEASRAEEEVRRKELAEAKFDEVAAIRRAYVAVVVARSALPALQQSVEAARANFAQADARFRGGLGTAVELADAEAILADAEIQLALGVFDVARSRASFGRTIAEGI